MNRLSVAPLIASLLVSGGVAAQDAPKIVPKTVAPAAAPASQEVFDMNGVDSVPESYPFGPGDRSARLKVKLLSGETTNNVQYWVLYSTDKSLLTGAKIGSDFPHGRAKVAASQSTGEIFADFIFPHADHQSPNVEDVKQKVIGQGKTVHYKWVKKTRDRAVESPIVSFEMPDKLTIVNMGDSYASGEGAPNASGTKWQDERCHRSGNSGQALAVKQLKAGNPGIAVAFRNVACSGAGVTDGLIQSQKKKGFLQSESHSTAIKPQIEQVKEWLSSNGHDTAHIVLLSIGINEIGFDTLVADFFILPGNIADDKKARGNLETDIKELKQLYDAVKNAFDESFDYEKVIVSGYPDLTRGKNGKFCGTLLDIPGYGLCWGVVELTSGEAEFEVANEQGTAMNERIKSVVKGFSGHEWVYGGDAASASKLHGLCNCGEPWFNTIGASVLVQGDFDGTWHPNRAGHREFVKPVIFKDLKIEVLKIRIRYAKERAKEIAKEEAKRKIKAKILLAQTKAVAVPAFKSASGAPKAIPQDIKKQAEADAKKLPKQAGGEDNNAADDKEPK